MQLNLRSILLHNAVLKIASFILGFIFWYFASQTYSTLLQLQVPLSFYNLPSSATLEAPETLAITLRAQRKHLYTLDAQALAIHINGSTLHDGPNHITVNSESLFLPESIKLVHYTPSNSIITLHAKN